MEMKEQTVKIGFGKCDDHRSRAAGSTQRPFQTVSGSSTPRHGRAAETMTDREYTKFMEERYGILAEGFF